MTLNGVAVKVDISKMFIRNVRKVT